MEISVDLANARLQAVVDFMAMGAGSASAELYENDLLLVAVSLVEPFGTVNDGVLLIAVTPESLIGATGNANRCVFRNGAGVVAWVSTVPDQAGNGEVKLESTTLYAGGFTRIVGGVLG